jgi:hypothetical protein
MISIGGSSVNASIGLSGDEAGVTVGGSVRLNNWQPARQKVQIRPIRKNDLDFIKSIQ